MYAFDRGVQRPEGSLGLGSIKLVPELGAADPNRPRTAQNLLKRNQSPFRNTRLGQVLSARTKLDYAAPDNSTDST